MWTGRLDGADKTTLSHPWWTVTNYFLKLYFCSTVLHWVHYDPHILIKQHVSTNFSDSGLEQLPTIIQSDLLETQGSRIPLAVFGFLLDAQHLSWAGQQRVLLEGRRGLKGSS